MNTYATQAPCSPSPSALRVMTASFRERASENTQHLAHVCLEDAYRRFAPYVAAIGVRIVGRDDDLDDLVQDVFVQAMRGIARLSSPDALKAWLARITVRIAVRRLRRKKLLRAVHLQLDDAQYYESHASTEATPEERTLIARAHRALDQLAANDRAAWVLRHVHGQTLEQAAELCACSLSTYQRRLRRAAELLDKLLHVGANHGPVLRLESPIGRSRQRRAGCASTSSASANC